MGRPHRLARDGRLVVLVFLLPFLAAPARAQTFIPPHWRLSVTITVDATRTSRALHSMQPSTVRAFSMRSSPTHCDRPTVRTPASRLTSPSREPRFGGSSGPARHSASPEISSAVPAFPALRWTVAPPASRNCHLDYASTTRNSSSPSRTRPWSPTLIPAYLPNRILSPAFTSSPTASSVPTATTWPTSGFCLAA
jgi:hypothetical protein